VIQLIVFLVFGGFGVVMLYVGVTQFFLQRELTADPRRVTATIVHSAVKQSKSADTDNRPLRDNSTTSHDPEVRFTYTIDGKTYESDLLRPTIIVRTYASRSSAEKELEPFPLGATVEAYYGVRHPAKAFLVLEKSVGPVVFIVVGIVVPIVAWFARKLI
jgi:hypothetical protein